VLGFDLSKFSTISLQNQLRLDVETWNNNGKQSSQLFTSTTPAKDDDDEEAISWFPWIPTKSQIWSLQEPRQLQMVCRERGLIESGTKPQLRQRLWEWTIQQQQHQEQSTKFLLESFQQQQRAPSSGSNTIPIQTSSSSPNSLEEWARTVDLDPLLQRRQEIRQQREDGGVSSTKNKANEDESDDDDDHYTALPRFKRKDSEQQQEQQATKDYLMSLTKAIEAPSSPFSSNEKVKQLYTASKQADQLGERVMAKQLLSHLIELTPNDGRLYRRLARMSTEDGDIQEAHRILQQATQRLPDNAFLWHGLAQLEHKQRQNDIKAREYFRKAIEVDPTMAHSYHALGTLEHASGHVARARKILQIGIKNCPTNHRLHHALGDVYRGAKFLDDADRSYRRALKYGPPVSHSFAYSALAIVAYERNDMDQCRAWLRKSVSVNNGRHAQGWVSLAQVEESLGNIEAARAVSAQAIAQYEYTLVEMNQHYKEQFQRNRVPTTTPTTTSSRRRGSSDASNNNNDKHSSNRGINRRPPVRKLKIRTAPSSNNDDNDSNDHRHKTNHLAIKNVLLRSVPAYRSGDKFVRVYRNWARLEEKCGTFEMVNDVYARASVAFPKDYRITLDWAQYHATLRNLDRARALFTEACGKSAGGHRHSDPFRLYAAFEMERGNYLQARSILFYGARVVTGSVGTSSSSSSSQKSSSFRSPASTAALWNPQQRHALAQLYHTWAVCEWRLKNHSRSQKLFDHALSLLGDDNDNDGDGGDSDDGEDSKLRAYTLFSLAKLHYETGEYYLAQHFIGLCLKENNMPHKSNELVWNLWADVAHAMGNPSLQQQCEEYSELEASSPLSVPSSSSTTATTASLQSSSSSSTTMTASKVQEWIRQEPWHLRLFGTTMETESSFYTSTRLPSSPEEDEAKYNHHRHHSMTGTM